ncbi:EamA family transporter [Aneurinibacillus terranovensis]|uniref:EamA family transporter n=1 Tax=Aneurinibacillus terranovensis TaxID=278991 RepID=UPI0004220650|nr:EamA family transporter [Aneurinibacillus terranovensis]
MVYWRSVLLVFLGSCSYGILSTFVKFAYREGFTAGEINGSQMFLGACMMWLLTFFMSRGKAGARQWLLLVGIGVCVGLTGIFYYRSLKYIPASVGIVLLFQFTWIGVLAEALIERKWPGVEKIAALVFLFVGTILAGDIFHGGLQQFTLAGVVLGLLSAVTYAFFILCSGRVSTTMNPWLRSSIMLTGSALITFIIYPPVFLTNGSLSHGLLKWGLLLAFFGAFIPTLFFVYGAPYIGSGLATILGASELPMAVFMSKFVLKESVSVLQWIGVIIILAGVGMPELLNRKRKKIREQSP